MIIGFTGTRNGMTEEQVNSVREVIKELCPSQGIHGDCLGADEDFNKLCLEAGAETSCLPCTLEGMRANCTKEIAEPKSPMQRNRDIVILAHAMIACPPNYTKIKRGSGTWATIGFTRRAKKPLYIVFPNGKIQKENVL